MNIEEGTHIPILLGRPFLTTIGAIIDVKKGKVTFEVGDKKIEFILSKFMKNPFIGDSYYQVNIIHERAREYSSEPLPTDGLETYLISRVNLKNDEAHMYVILLDKNHVFKTNASNYSQHRVPKMKARITQK